MKPTDLPSPAAARWATVVNLFHQVVDQPASERERLLQEGCRDAPDLRGEVESLLAADAAADTGDLEQLGVRAAAAWVDAAPASRESLVGRSLGRYRIEAVLGAGGMGTVYRAVDPSLHRDVALKVLPATVASSVALRLRLQQEARAASSLNHPNIVTVYEVGCDDGIDFIAAELIAGETIRARLSSGPLSLRDVVDIGAQVATALAAAHAAGLVHRDVKPENVILRPDGVVKVLDFGLAMLVPPASLAYLGGGGTASYMSPEQALGERIDHRSDLFSLGVMLYEMVTGRLPFAGDTDAALVDAIVHAPAAPPSQVRSGVAPAVDLLIARALEKDAELRYQSASDLAADLKRLRRVSSPPPQGIVATTPAKGRRHWRWAIGAGLLAVIGGLTVSWPGVPPPRAAVPVRFSIPAPPGTTFTLASTMVPAVTLAVSPDGRAIAFLANRPGEPPQIWLRALDALEAEPVTGTEGAAFPFWSPDSRSLGFIADDGLRTIAASGGTARTLVDRRDVRGATWNTDGVILYGVSEGPIQRVPASGGAPTPVTTLDPARGDVWHRWPYFLPDGRHFLYLVRSGAETPRLMLGTLDGRRALPLFESRARAQHVQGHVLFLDGGTLTARGLHDETFALSSDSMQIAGGVARSTAFDASFSASDTGVLAFASRAPPSGQLTWFDRAGRRLGVLGAEAEYLGLRLSPDGTRVGASATDVQENTPDVWLLDVARNVTSRVTSDPWIDLAPVWAPDGHRVTFSSSRLGPFQLFHRSVDDGATETPLFSTPRTAHPDDWTPDGRAIVCSITSPTGGGYDLVLMDAHTGAVTDLVASRYSEYQGRVSPDGTLLAYTSDETGRPEVFVSRLDRRGPRVQISSGGASDPAWSQVSRELFYLAADGYLTRADVSGTGDDRLRVGASRPLFATRLPNTAAPYGNSYVVSPDGQRFLVNTQVRDTPPPAITVIVDWLAALGRRD